MTIMKVLILIAAAGLMLTLSTWSVDFKPRPQTEASAQPQPTSTPDGSARLYADVKALLFADQSLEEVLKHMEKKKKKKKKKKTSFGGCSEQSIFTVGFILSRVSKGSSRRC